MGIGLRRKPLLPRRVHGRPGDARGLRALRKSCRVQLSALDLPDAFDLSTLRDRLSETRGKPIHVVPMSLEVSGPCGLWISLTSAEYVVYEEKTSRHHRDHIIAHEYAHMICDHRVLATPTAPPVPAPGAGVMARLLPGLEPSLAERVLVRDNLSDAQEREAEMLASIILTGAARPRRNSPDGTVGRAGRALGFR